MSTIQTYHTVVSCDLLYFSSLTDDQLLDLAFRAVNSDDLSEPGKVSLDDFTEVINY